MNDKKLYSDWVIVAKRVDGKYYVNVDTNSSQIEVEALIIKRAKNGYYKPTDLIYANRLSDGLQYTAQIVLKKEDT